MAQSLAGANSWVTLNVLGWDGTYIEKEKMDKLVEAISRTNPVYFKQPQLAFEQLFYYFFNVAVSFKGLDNDLAYNAHIAMWICNNCRASLAKPSPHPPRIIDEKEEYSKFFPHRAYLPRHRLADRIERAKEIIRFLPHGLNRSSVYTETEVERFLGSIEDDYPAGILPIDLALVVESLKQSVKEQRRVELGKVLGYNVQIEQVPITTTTTASPPTYSTVLASSSDAGSVEPVVHQPRGDERSA